MITSTLAKTLILEQFPEYKHLPITEVKQQGHDNRTYRLGQDMVIRIPTAESYALNVSKEQALLPKLSKHLTTPIPTPIKMGEPSATYPYPFSIYQWLDGQSANHVTPNETLFLNIASSIASFLTELHSINIPGPKPGQHNWWRGDHISVYNQGTQEQLSQLSNIINTQSALSLWEKACDTSWESAPVWIHGDLAIGNILIKHNQVSGIIDFGGLAVGDPACDLVIAWTYLPPSARKVFINSLTFDDNTWIRARAWALWKATFELCQIKDKSSPEASIQKKIIDATLND